MTSMVVGEDNLVYTSRDSSENECNCIMTKDRETLVIGCKNTIIPSSVETIGVRAFFECTALTSITIPDSVTEIGLCAFQNCTGLTSITIPDSVTQIINGAFESCTGLISITINRATPPTLEWHAFNDTNNCPIYVLAGSVSAYKSAQYWSDYADRIQAIA